MPSCVTLDLRVRRPDPRGLDELGLEVNSTMPQPRVSLSPPILSETSIEYLETIYNTTVEGDPVVNVRLAEDMGDRATVFENSK